MFELTYEQKKAVGFQYVLDMLAPCTPYGVSRMKDLKAYTRTEYNQLEEEYGRMSALLSAWSKWTLELQKISRILMQMKEIRGALKRGSDVCLNDIELFEIKQFLIRTEQLQPILKSMQMQSLFEGIVLYETKEALDLLDPERKRIPGFYISDAYSKQLGIIRKDKKRIEIALRHEHTKDKEEQLFIERKKQVVLEDEEEQKIREHLTKQLRLYFEWIMHNTIAVGHIDLLLQKVEVAKRNGGIRPTLTKEKLIVNKLRNPEMEQILENKGKIFTPISFSMENGVAVITGANMGGKSVALKTIALNIALVHYGFFVYATQAEIPIYDYFQMIADEFESVSDGLSSFGGEIVELQKAMAQIDDAYAFILFDEFARGTNPEEGAAIVQAVVKFLNNHPIMAVFATHYDHVAEHANFHYQVYGLRNMNMDLVKQELSCVKGRDGIGIISKYMDYGIYPVKEKVDCPRDAIHICHLLGVDMRILDLIENVK